MWLPVHWHFSLPTQVVPENYPGNGFETLQVPAVKCQLQRMDRSKFNMWSRHAWFSKWSNIKAYSNETALLKSGVISITDPPLVALMNWPHMSPSGFAWHYIHSIRLHQVYSHRLIIQKWRASFWSICTKNMIFNVQYTECYYRANEFYM